MFAPLPAAPADSDDERRRRAALPQPPPTVPTGTTMQAVPATAQGLPAAMQPAAQEAPKPFGWAPQAKPLPGTSARQAGLEQEFGRLASSKPGWEQVQSTPGKVALGIADTLGSIFAPRIAAALPGTTLHHQVLLNRADRAMEQGEKAESEAQRRSLIPTEQAEREAQTEHIKAETDALKNPTKTGAAATINTGKGIMQWNPETQRYDISVGEAPEKPGNVHVLPSGEVVAIHTDPATGESTAHVVYRGDPRVQTEVAKLEVNGEEHTVLVNKQTGETVKDLGKTGEKPPNVNVNTGTLSLAEDAEGNPVTFNNRTGAVSPVSGIHKAGTYAKNVAPAKQAAQYAQDYISGGNFTGPGDEALMERFFELAKPSSGFRMTRNQQDMLIKSRSWMGGTEAKIRHGLTGKWFSDEQRRQIAQTMATLGAERGIHAEGGSGGAHGAPAVGAIEDGYRFKGGDPSKPESWERAH